MPAIFELNNVSFSYLGRIPALCGVNFVVEKTQKVVIMGANGTGKSTLLTLLDALIFPDSGVYKAFGQEICEDLFSDDKFSFDFRKKVGFVFQNPDVQLFSPTVKEDILFGPLQLGVGLSEAKKRMEKLAETLKFSHLLDRSVHQLSIGEKKKIAIAGVLAIKPEVLLLDEPTAGLDPQTTRDIIDIILEENQKGTTVITATHDLHIMGEIADIVHVFSKENSVIRSQSPAGILADTEFLNNHNLMHVHRHKHEGVVHSHPHTHLDHHSQH